MRVAIVGSGVSGLVAAHLLDRHHEVTLIESADRLGGHTNTVRVESGTGMHDIDTGFIVYNERNYPNFTRFLSDLGVPTQPSDMSFSVSSADPDTEWAGTSLGTLFAQPSNVIRPSFGRMLTDIVRFNRQARGLLTNAGDDPSLEDFVDRIGLSRSFMDRYLIPMGAAIWSADPSTFARFPAAHFARFFDNHGLLSFGARPEWRTISGGSVRYIDAILARFSGRILLGQRVGKVVRRPAEVEVHMEGLGPATFDRIVIAAHSDQALDMLADPSAAEKQVLGAIRYQPNSAVLHTDESLMPRRRRAWASWNTTAVTADDRRVALTYHMNRLQALGSERDFFVTLNRNEAIDEAKVIASFEYMHPVFDHEALAAQRRHGEIDGLGGVHFAGAYWGYGFHEDGVVSAMRVCRSLGALR